MTSTLNILSWNIQKFGADKRTDPAVINFICQVIAVSKADIVGIMELVGQQGNEARDTLVASLNNLESINKTGVTWAGEPSEMTPSRPNEQYLFLWKTNVWKVERWHLWNVMNDNAFDDFFAQNQSQFPQDKDKQQFWQSLIANGWLDSGYKMPLDKFQLLYNKSAVDATKLDLNQKDPKFNLTSLQKTAVVQALVAPGPVTFPLPGSRPPFVLWGKDNGSVEMSFVLFHAPSAASNLHIAASNQLSFLEPVQSTNTKVKVCVVMGDFNIDAATSGKTSSLNYFDLPTQKLQYVRDASNSILKGYPFQRLTGGDFDGQAKDITLSKVENYEKLLWTDKTTISSSLATAKTKPQDILSSEFDKFFVRSTSPGQSRASVFAVIDLIIQGGSLTLYAKQAYNNWLERSQKKGQNKDLLPLKITRGNTSLALIQAQSAYLRAISDHLPICLELQY